MQNIHLINSFTKPLNEFLDQPEHLPSITSLYGPDCKLLFPDIKGEPISIFYSQFLERYLIFFEDEIFVDNETEPFFSFPFLINFACLSQSGDIAILVSGSFPNDVYIFDVYKKEYTKLDYNNETNNFEAIINTNTNEANIYMTNNDTDDSEGEISKNHQCNGNSCNCTCNQPKSALQPNPPLNNEDVTHASFRNDNEFAAIATKSYIHTIYSKISSKKERIDQQALSDQQGLFDQQGIYDHEVCDPCGVTWNPQGSWLAFGNKNKIIFTEKNCRLRQMYELDDKEATPIALSWSPHPDILAFIDDHQRITILSMKNRVIYRKYVIDCLDKSISLIPQIFWSRNSDDLSLAVIDRNTGNAYIYEFNHSVDKNENSIFVINGNTLNISDWSKSIIPPPLSHRKVSFGEPTNQITAIASNNEEIAVFTLSSIHLLMREVEIPLQNASPVQCATFTKNNKDVLAFASKNVIYSISLALSNFSISVDYRFEDESKFVSFLSPSFVVTSRTQISPLDSPGTQTAKSPSLITEFVQGSSENEQIISNDYVSFCSREGTLFKNGDKIADKVKSFLYDEKLLAYVYTSTLPEDLKLCTSGYLCHIQYGSESTSRQIEPFAQLLFFSKHIYSIITLMNRGNIESNAPHVIVESALRNLIKDQQYAEAWRLSKKYQVPFSKYIMLGPIQLNVLCEQIPDTQLRSCMSVLRPVIKENKDNKDSNTEINISLNQLEFVLNFLSYILGVKVIFDDKKVIVPPYDCERPELAKFPTTCCICFVLLDSAVEAVRLACCFKTSDLVKRCITFLLTLYDNNSLYDISLKTYDTNCIASVGLITMKEPSLYVPFIEELNQVEDDNLRKAKIDEAASDPSSAIEHYSLAGPEYDEKALYIIERDLLFDKGLSCYPRDSETWLKIIQMKLKYLTGLDKKEKEKKDDEIAQTAIHSHNLGIILQHIQEIVKCKKWQLAIPYLAQDEEAYQIVKKTLEDARCIKEAALFTTQYIPLAKQEAARLFKECHEWYSAIQNGADETEIALFAFDVLMDEATKNTESASKLKAKFEDIKEKQKIHKDSMKRHGKNKEKRGLPAIVVQLNSILPDQNKTNEYRQIIDILNMIGENEKSAQLQRAFRNMVQAINPIPHLPENEELPLAPYLQGCA